MKVAVIENEPILDFFLKRINDQLPVGNLEIGQRDLLEWILSYLLGTKHLHFLKINSQYAEHRKPKRS